MVMVALRLYRSAKSFVPQMKMVALITLLLCALAADGQRVCEFESFTDRSCSILENPEQRPYTMVVGQCIKKESTSFIELQEVNDGFELRSYFDELCSQPRDGQPDRWTRISGNCYSACFFDMSFVDCGYETVTCTHNAARSDLHIFAFGWVATRFGIIIALLVKHAWTF